MNEWHAILRFQNSRPEGFRAIALPTSAVRVGYARTQPLSAPLSRRTAPGSARWQLPLEQIAERSHLAGGAGRARRGRPPDGNARSEEHTSELQSHSFISYA